MKTTHNKFVLLAIVIASLTTAYAQDPLPSWNDGPTKKSITEFVAKVTKEGSPDFVPPEERIATLDNDGTLWCEQPLYFQLLFALDRVKALAPQHPEWKTKEPFASLLKGDVKGALAGGERAMLEIIVATHAGMTTAEFEQIVKDWIATAKHPKFKRPYTECVYQPMVELLAYLRANGFKNFIDDKTGKPVGINSHIGRRPIAAFGNSDGDQQMLEWTQAGSGARLMMLVHHDDATREFAYGAESKIGTFSDALMAEAKKSGWTVISMKNDWKQIFAFEN